MASRKRTVSESASSAVSTSNVSNTSSAPSKKTKTEIKEELDLLLHIEKPDHTKFKVDVPAGKRCDATKLDTNSFVYRPARIQILGNGRVRNQDLYAENAPGADWNLGSELISSQCWSADQYTRDEKIAMMAMVSLLKEQVGDGICKVEFLKLPDIIETAKLIQDGANLIESSDLPQTEKTRMFKKLCERAQVGEYRVMRGYISRSDNQAAQESETGMLKFIDAELMAEGKFSVRPINLRNIQALTFKLVRYELK